MKYHIELDKLILNVDDNNIIKTIEETKKIKNKCDKSNLILVLYYNDKLINKKSDKYSKELNDLIEIKDAINIKNLEDRYNYIYDTVCKKLDDRIINENYCEFENDMCIKSRKENTNHKNGCCEWEGRGKCKYLIDSVCTMKTCMACKLFTCKFLLKEKGIRQRPNDYPLVKYFFNNNQKYILECSFWTPKEIVMKRLLNNKYNIKE